MKLGLLKLSLFLLTGSVFGQNFQLAEPDVSKLREQATEPFTSEVIYLYLTNNYKPITEKQNIAYLEWEPSVVCSFSQEFENGIKYNLQECREAGGSTVSLQFPKMERDALKKWIEGIYEVTKQDWENNVWKENDTKFEPKESDAGCYYKIQDNNQKTTISIYCGC